MRIELYFLCFEFFVRAKIRDMVAPSKRWYFRRMILLAALLIPLACIAADAEPAPIAPEIKTSIEQLESADLVTRMRAVNALALAGPKAEAAITKLLELSEKDEKGYVQENACRALACIGDKAFEAIFQKLAALSVDKDYGSLKVITNWPQSSYYAGMLANFDPAFRSKMVAHLSDENPVVVRACINALATNWHRQILDPHRPKPPEFLPAVKALIDHKDGVIRAAARETVEEIEHPRFDCMSFYR